MAKKFKFYIFLWNNFEFIGIKDTFIGVWVSMKIDKGIPMLNLPEKKSRFFENFTMVYPFKIFQKNGFYFFSRKL
jgi:hypothetical protein